MITCAVGNRTDRFNYYRQIKPDLIVFAEISIAQEFDKTAAIWSAQLKREQKSDFWFQVKANRAVKPIASTRAGLFLPWRELKTIIVDDPNHPGNRQGQSPRFQAKDVALRLGLTFSADVVLGMPVLGVEAAHKVLSRSWRLARLSKIFLPEIITRKNALAQVEPNGKTLYFLPKKGEYLGTDCRSCESLQPYPAPVKCLKCGGTSFRPYGIGTLGLAAQLEKIHQKDVAVVDQSHSINQLSIINYQLVVATHKIFDYNGSFNTIIVSHFDHLLRLPDPMMTEHIYEMLTKLAQMTTTLIIDTSYPGHDAIRWLGKPNKFYRQELVKRREHLLPPYRRIIKLTSARLLASPKLPKLWLASPRHQNTSGEYQIICRAPSGAYLRQEKLDFGSWRLEPDPVSLL